MASETPTSHVPESSASLDQDGFVVQQVTSSAFASELVDVSAPQTVDIHLDREETENRVEVPSLVSLP